MSWLHAALPLVTTVGVILVVGAPIAFALRARGFSFIALTVAGAFAVLAISPIAAGFAGVTWGIIPAFILAIIVAILCLALWRVTGPKHSPVSTHGHLFKSQRPWMPLLGAAAGGVVILAMFVRRMWGPDSISQTYDANFHLNLVSQMLESGNASPFNVDLSSPGHDSFYPAAWHSTVALISQISGANIPLATNALLLFCVGVVWPIGVVTLARALFGPSTRVSLIAGIVSATIPAVPYTLGAYGILYPTLLATVLTPFALTAALKILRLGYAHATDPLRSTTKWIYLLGLVGAISLAQPAGLHAFLILATPAVVAALFVSFRTASTVRKTFNIVAFGVYTSLVIAIWYISRTADNDWQTRQGLLSAAWDVLSGAPRFDTHAWVLLVLAVIASVLVFLLKKFRWLTASWLLAVVFYAISDGLPLETVRTALTGPWYNDSWRLGAVAMTATIPLVIFSLNAIAVTLRYATRHSSLAAVLAKRRFLSTPALMLILLVSLQSPAMNAISGYIQTKYEPRAEKASLLDEDERALIERLADEIPDDAKIINNPWNGGALAEALAGREVLIPHTGGNYPEERYEIIDGIAQGDPESCALALEENALYVLDFGTKYVFKDTPRAKPFENITDINPEDAPALTEVDHEGEAVLYQVTGC